MHYTTEYPQLFEQHKNVLKLFESGYNVLLYGCHQSGKRTFIQQWVNKKYGECEWLKETFQIHNERKTNIELSIRKSKYHVEILLHQFGNNEKYVMKVIQKLCSHMIINNEGYLSKKTVVLYGINHLSKESFNILKVIVEKYHSCFH